MLMFSIFKANLSSKSGLFLTYLLAKTEKKTIKIQIVAHFTHRTKLWNFYFCESIMER